jgi:hypothetical protein
MQSCFVILNQSTKDPSYGAVTPDVLSLIALGLEAQANDDFCPEFGGSVAVRVGSSPTDLGPGEIAIRLVDDLSQVAPGAAAYHDDESGLPVIWCALDEFDSFTGPSDMPLSAGISHEMLETLGDRGANQWADRPDGTQEAEEECDRLQKTDYQKTTASGVVQVANFLLQSAWIPGAAGPWDFRAVLANQYDTMPDGYVILRQQGGALGFHRKPIGRAPTVKVGFGAALDPSNMSEKTLARKRHPASRTYRRGAAI